MAARAAAEQARDIERARYDGPVHDRVLAKMLAARRSGVEERCVDDGSDCFMA